jgi:hypothetical protein
MQREEITIRVDADVSRLNRAASEHQRQKIDLLLSYWIRDFATVNKSLKEVMREISRKAEERGMTPEILASIPDPL